MEKSDKKDEATVIKKIMITYYCDYLRKEVTVDCKEYCWDIDCYDFGENTGILICVDDCGCGVEHWFDNIGD